MTNAKGYLLIGFLHPLFEDVPALVTPVFDIDGQIGLQSAPGGIVNHFIRYDVPPSVRIVPVARTDLYVAVGDPPLHAFFLHTSTVVFGHREIVAQFIVSHWTDIPDDPFLLMELSRFVNDGQRFLAAAGRAEKILGEIDSGIAHRWRAATAEPVSARISSRWTARSQGLNAAPPVVSGTKPRSDGTSFIFGKKVNWLLPVNVNYWWSFGSILTFILGVQIVTGIVLAMHYVPHIEYAFNSIERIMREVNYGWLLRDLHANGASMFFLAGYIHILRGLYYGSYKKPRELSWVVGVILLLLMFATDFMGHVLPWTQMSFWTASVITNKVSAIPLMGESIVTWLWGGYSVGNPTLNRFYSLHYLLPFVIVAVVGVHVWAVYVVGPNNPSGIEAKSKHDTVALVPYATIKDAFFLVCFCVLFAWFVFYLPDYFGVSENYVPANPEVTPTRIVPAWYYLPFYAILHAPPSKLGGVVVLVASIAVLAVVPWLDTSRVRSATYRPLYKQFFWIFVLVCVFLGWLGSKPAEEGNVIAVRILTAWYFIHFLIILPLLGLFETPNRLPSSISDAELRETMPIGASAVARARDKASV